MALGKADGNSVGKMSDNAGNMCTDGKLFRCIITVPVPPVYILYIYPCVHSVLVYIYIST